MSVETITVHFRNVPSVNYLYHIRDSMVQNYERKQELLVFSTNRGIWRVFCQSIALFLLTLKMKSWYFMEWMHFVGTSNKIYD